MTRPLHNVRTSFTPENVDWLIWQAVQVMPALTSEIYRLQKYRQKLETILEEKTLNADQRRELSALLDTLYKRGIIAGALDGQDRDDDGRFIGGETP